MLEFKLACYNFAHVQIVLSMALLSNKRPCYRILCDLVQFIFSYLLLCLRSRVSQIATRKYIMAVFGFYSDFYAYVFRKKNLVWMEY